ncbi:MAG: hypothetical protein BWX88_00732 [Planctomycetes bacterium ADurb.Bin126]|nr:MAG: hypothetical protein BWX88_00732 [Planctomycetes bacterium ADurb.Bin126]
MKRTMTIRTLATALGVLAAAGVLQAQANKQPTTKPASNLDFWLNRAKTADSSKQVNPMEQGKNPFAAAQFPFQREDALPGVVELSDGRVVAGGVYTTREKPWEIWIEAEKRWRQIPFLNCLSINAVVLEEKMEQRWRWKEMGVPEKVFTGKEYPFRIFEWKLHLIDDSYLQGTVKGQPVYVETVAGKTFGPLVLHERFSGPDGMSLKEAVYVKRVIVSRRLFDQFKDASLDAQPTVSSKRTGTEAQAPSDDGEAKDAQPKNVPKPVTPKIKVVEPPVFK